MRIPRLWLSALLLSAAAGACRDLPTAAPATQPTQESRVQLRCAVEVRARTVSCDPAGPRGIRRQIILGGQGLNVRLRTTNVEWNGSDNVLSADISVQNLLDQPIGTDGNGGTHGVRVFFVSGPNVTDGSGEVTVLADSVGTFTAGNQKYYVYPEIIQPRGVSSPVTWQFAVPPEALRFEFMVLVETETPAESSLLHFRPEHGSPVYGLPVNGVWAANAHDVFAVSEGTVLHYDGNYWRAMDAGEGCGCEATLYSVWGSDGRDVWAVGTSANVRHWTGTTWDAVDVPAAAGADLYSIWGAGADDIWAVGDAGTILHYDGGDWTASGLDGLTQPVNSVWGANTENVWAVTAFGTVLHYDGAWQQDTTFQNTSLFAVWGTSGSDIWAAGETNGDGGFAGALFHYDGEAWTQVADPELDVAPLYAGWSSGPTDVWVTSGGDVLHWDGESWTRLQVASGAPLYGITGSGPADVFTVGEIGTIAHSTGGAFTDMSFPDADIHGIWGSSATDVWAVSQFGILHTTGDGTWTQQFAPDGAQLNAVWGAGASQVWAVGAGGVVAYYDGADWATVYEDPAAAGLNGVWGSSASDVWAVGYSAAVEHWDGAAWSSTTVGTDDLLAVWGSGAGDVFAVGANGAIQHWNGAGWTQMNSGTTEWLYGVWGTGANDVYAVGDNGTVLHYDGNPAGDWTPVTTGAPTGASVFAVWGSGANDVFILANNGLDLMHWDGATWKTMTQFSANADVWMYTLWGSGPRDLYAAGDVGTILHGKR